jgi:hypothetical protein
MMRGGSSLPPSSRSSSRSLTPSFHNSALVTIAPDPIVEETSALIFRFLEANR